MTVACQCSNTSELRGWVGYTESCILCHDGLPSPTTPPSPWSEPYLCNVCLFKCIVLVKLTIIFTFRLKQLESGGELRPARGPKKKIQEGNEKEMADYCNFCWEIGIPKTQERFAREVVHYMEYFRITDKFKRNEPGIKNIYFKYYPQTSGSTPVSHLAHNNGSHQSNGVGGGGAVL